MTKIKLTQAKFETTMTLSNNLTEMQMKEPAIRDVMEFVDTRMVSTMIVSGVDSPLTAKTKKTKIGSVDKSKHIGSNGYRYRVMGRIQRRSVIIAQVGASQPDGSFTLNMRDNLLYKGMVVRFYTGLQAIVHSGPTGSPGNYQYVFQTTNGTVFVYATHVAPQPGEKTCFGGHTAYGEASLAGYSRAFNSEEYENHMTTQRKSFKISGSAMSDQVMDVTIVDYLGKKGWFFTKEAEGKVQFMMEDEYEKWFGESTMRDANGALLAQSRLTDQVTGNPIIIGDGIVEQIRGMNDLSPSGVDGMPTMDDIKDMMTMLKKNASGSFGNHWYVITGTDGYQHFGELLRDYWVNYLGGRTNINNGQESIDVGANFDSFTWMGNKVTVVLHDMFDNQELFAQLAADGKSVQSGSYIWLNNGFNSTSAGQRNVEILSKGAYGVNRSMVTNSVNGLTGFMEKPSVTSVDAYEVNWLKEDMIVIYNTSACGLMNKPAA